MSQLVRVLALALAALALLAAGCGDDEDEGDTGATGATGAAGAPLTVDEWVAQADEICAEGDREIDQAGRELFGGGQPTDAELEEYTTGTLIPSIQSQIDEIETLSPPEGDEDETQQFLETAQEELDALEADPSTLQGNPFAETQPLARQLGLQECAN